MLARLTKANDPALETVRWCGADVGNAEVARLAEGIDGNTVLQTVDLHYNRRLSNMSTCCSPRWGGAGW